MNLFKDIVVAVKGFFMGAANVVPGVSGGTIALVSGIYSEIIAALNSVMDISVWKLLLKGKWGEWWKGIHGRFLLTLAVGVIVSVFSLAKLMTFVLANFPVQTWAFFFGLILASAWFMLRDVKGWKATDALFVGIGLVLGLVVCTLSPTQTPETLLFVFLCGALAICTMILPGVSGSFILVVMGKYDYIMDAVSSLNLPVLAAFALGCGVGILAFAKLLNILLAKWEKQTMLVLVGFVIGSLIKVWPWSNMDAIAASQGLVPGSPVEMHYMAAAIWCVLGVAFIAAIEILSRKKK